MGSLAHMLHPGLKKQALDMQRWFKMDEIGLYNAVKQVKKAWLFCQVCSHHNRNVKGEAQWSPISDQPIESVAIDFFSVCEVHSRNEVLDCMVPSVDRHVA